MGFFNELTDKIGLRMKVAKLHSDMETEIARVSDSTAHSLLHVSETSMQLFWKTVMTGQPQVSALERALSRLNAYEIAAAQRAMIYHFFWMLDRAVRPGLLAYKPLSDALEMIYGIDRYKQEEWAHQYLDDDGSSLPSVIALYVTDEVKKRAISDSSLALLACAATAQSQTIKLMEDINE